MGKKKEAVNHASIGLKFENLEPIENTGFVRGECKVAYAGKNRNGTLISREAFEDAEKTIFGTPIVGNWIEDSGEKFGGRFGGHDVILETKGNEMTIKDNTTPFGFVPQDANPRWVSIEDENGNSKNYYTVDVILWRERYKDQIDSIIENKANQSMEIMVGEGDWEEDSSYFNITEFYYSALCLLGKDSEDSSKNVEPCFEDADVSVENFTVDERFSLKMSELKEAFEGGASVKKEEKIVKEKPVKKVKKKKDEKVGVDEVDYKMEFAVITEKYKQLESEHDKLERKNDKLVKEVEVLEEYKASKEKEIMEDKKDALIADYKLILDEDIIAEVCDNKEELSIEELEHGLSDALAKDKIAKAKKEREKKDEEIVIDNEIFDKKDSKSKFAI